MTRLKLPLHQSWSSDHDSEPAAASSVLELIHGLGAFLPIIRSLPNIEQLDHANTTIQAFSDFCEHLENFSNEISDQLHALEELQMHLLAQTEAHLCTSSAIYPPQNKKRHQIFYYFLERIRLTTLETYMEFETEDLSRFE
jgi:hypothetical protein